MTSQYNQRPGLHKTFIASVRCDPRPTKSHETEALIRVTSGDFPARILSERSEDILSCSLGCAAFTKLMGHFVQALHHSFISFRIE